MKHQNKNNLFIDIRFLVIKNDFLAQIDDFEIMKIKSEKVPDFSDIRYRYLFTNQNIEYYELLWKINKEQLYDNRKKYYLYLYSYPPVSDVFLCEAAFYLTLNNFNKLCNIFPELENFYNNNDTSIFEKKLGIYNGFETYILKRKFYNKFLALDEKNDNTIDFQNYFNKKNKIIIIQKIH